MKKVKSVFLLALAVLTVASVSCVSGTYAKFTGEAKYNTSDEVRIAKFDIAGLGKTNEVLNLFATTYNNKEDEEIIKSNGTEATDVIVAPGASGSSKEISFAFAPNNTIETNYTLNVQLATDEDGNGISTDLCTNVAAEGEEADYYCPIKYAIVPISADGSYQEPASSRYVALDTGLTSLNEQLTKLFKSKVFAANQVPKKSAVSFKVFWKWDENIDNTYDTKFLSDAEPKKVELKFDITAEQSTKTATVGASEVPGEGA